MVEIATIFHGASLGLMYDIHHIAISALCLIREDHHIASQNEAYTSHGPSIRPLASSTTVRMQPIRGQGRERGGKRSRGRLGRVGEQGGRRPSGRAAGRSIDETTMPLEYSTPAPEISIPHEFSTPPSYTFIPPTYSIPPHRLPIHISSHHYHLHLRP